MIGQVFIVARCRDGQACAAIDLAGVDVLYRGGEVDDVEALPQILGQAGVGELDEYLATAFTGADRDVRVGETDDDASLALGATTEIDFLDVMQAGGGACLRRGRLCSSGACSGAAAGDGQDNVAACHLALEGGKLHEVENHSGTITGLDGGDALDEAGADVLVLPLQAAGGLREIKHHPRRMIDGEAAWLGGGAVERQAYLHAVAGQGGKGDVLQSGQIAAWRRLFRCPFNGGGCRPGDRRRGGGLGRVPTRVCGQCDVEILALLADVVVDQFVDVDRHAGTSTGLYGLDILGGAGLDGQRQVPGQVVAHPRQVHRDARRVFTGEILGLRHFAGQGQAYLDAVAVELLEVNEVQGIFGKGLCLGKNGQASQGDASK